MTDPNPPNASRPSKFEDRYRLYLDESGDHVFREVSQPDHRFLCLLGCWFKNPDYLTFHADLEALKTRHFPHHPDNPVILHREEIINARKAFKNLQDPEVRKRFDSDLIETIRRAEFRIVAVVIDKMALRNEYGEAAAHPYHLGMGFMLQRYAGYLNHVNRTGDVMCEARGGREDRLLEDSYTRVYERGVWKDPSEFFQKALTSRELKVKTKSANISGLQLADILGHPVKQSILIRHGHIPEEQTPFAKDLLEAAEPKYNHQLYTGRVEGYGYVLFPKK
jgi:hypothetical protein